MATPATSSQAISFFCSALSYTSPQESFNQVCPATGFPVNLVQPYGKHNQYIEKTQEQYQQGAEQTVFFGSDMSHGVSGESG